MNIKLVYLLGVALIVANCGGGSTKTTGSSSGAAGNSASSEVLSNSRDRVYFDYDSCALTADAKSILGEVVETLKKGSSENLVVEGHADERGTREYNLALGERRGNSVKQYLIANGFKGQNITVISYGKERPAVIGHSESEYALNRRAVIVVGKK